MNFNDFLKKMWGFASTAGHALGAKEIFDLFKSAIPTAETLRSKGWYGIIGIGDEQDFQVLLLRLKKAKAEYRQAINETVAYVYPSKAGDWVNNILNWYYRGRFRQFVLGLPHKGPEIRIAKETIHRDGKDGGKVVREVPIFVDDAADYPFDWLKDLAETICAAGEPKSKERRAAMKQIKAEFALHNIPLPPEGYRARKREAASIAKTLVGKMKTVTSATRGVAKTAADSSVNIATAVADRTRIAIVDFNQKTETRRTNESRIDRFLREWM